jgi:diadenosine tetraphosphatase ApaH/serine/threonine PP2A family protein phosphatase
MYGTKAIGSDVHGNYHALEAVVADMERRGIPIDRLVLLGDTVGYNANSEKCARQVAENNVTSLLGNHGVIVLEKKGVTPPNRQMRDAMANTGQFNVLADAGADYAARTLSDDSIDYLSKRPFEARFNHSIGTHGGFLSFPQFFYFARESPERLEAEVECTFLTMKMKNDQPGSHPLKMCFVGHSHTPGYIRERWPIFYAAEDGQVIDVSASPLMMILDVGSIGQPRDRDPRASWVEYDMDKGVITFRRTPYDIDAAAAANKRAGLPDKLSERLYAGW